MKLQAGLLNTDGRLAAANGLAAIAPLLSRWPAETVGQVLDGPLAMAYRGRLVTREEQSEVQPCTWGPYTMTWDGRLDNREQIAERVGVGSSRHVPDALLVLQAYASAGNAVFAELVGEFALALWCRKTRRLLFARSVCGTRPLYYAWKKDALLWSSDFRQLVCAASLQLTVNESYLLEYLMAQPSPGHTPLTAFHVVPAGSFVAFGPTCAEVTHHPFWDPGAVPELRYRDDHEYEQHCRELLREAVAVRLSRVPGKVFSELSGGLDSSAVVMVGDEVLRTTDRPTSDLQTVSCVYEESSSCDETYFVRKVEEKRGVRSCYVHESEQQATLGLTNIFFSGLPSPHHCFPGRYPKFAACMQRQDARLLLTGSGGDHIFWSGSDGAPLISDELCRGRLLAAHQACWVWGRATGIPYVQLLGRSLRLALWGADTAPCVPSWLMRRQREQVRSFLWDFGRPNHGGALPSTRVKQHLVHSLFATTAAGYLNEYPGLYVTHPYTHRPLVEFCLAVPVSQLVRSGQSRSLMRRTLRGILPDAIVKRQTKGALDECVARALQREWKEIGDIRSWQLCQRGFAEPGTLLQSLERARLGLRLEDQSLVRIFSLERWLRSLDFMGPAQRFQFSAGDVSCPNTSLRVRRIEAMVPPAIAEAS